MDVYERSSRLLMGQGAGIVLNPATVRYFNKHALLDIGEVSISASWLRYVDRDGHIADEQPCSHRFSSYDTLYRGLLNSFAMDHYHMGEAISGFRQEGDGVDVNGAIGQVGRCDLLVCADGIRSSARRLLLPGTSLEYAGYIAWRGTFGAQEGQ